MVTKLTQEQVNAYCMGNRNMKIINIQNLVAVVYGKDGNYYLVEGVEDNKNFIKTIGLGRVA